MHRGGVGAPFMLALKVHRGEAAMDILDIIRQRQSSRVLFDPDRRIPDEHMSRILEGARWAPTAHNMQNFEIVVVDDRALLDELSKIRSEVSEVFVQENYEQLAFSEEELKRKKVGILGTMFPPSWRTPGVKPHVDEEHAHSVLGAPIRMSAALLVVLYDSRKRAPASENDALGMMSLGCVMENMWLVAQSLGIGFHVQSTFASAGVERDVRRVLGFPEPLRTAFAVRLGYRKEAAPYLRVRRELADFTHRNRFGRRGLP
jgi:nitroreductase